MKSKIAFVCQRYGLEVNGGAELLCRQFAEKLADIYSVEVLTTCAVDYLTWANEYPAGEEVINGVKVKRFPVDKKRNIVKFNNISGLVYNPNHSIEQEREWIDEQGPYCPELVCYIQKNHSEYKTVLFMTYLYYLTAVCLYNRIDNAILIPTAHDEPPIYLNYYKRVFLNPSGIIYNTAEEKRFVEKMFNNNSIPSIIAGAGVEVPDLNGHQSTKEKFGVDNYIVYAGRIDESKGCKTLFNYFGEYKKRYSNDLKLVLIGKSVMEIPKRNEIIYLGFVSEEDKFLIIRDSFALVLASEFESLSLVVLESMAMKRPVLVNGKCDVLRGHCTRSNAGLYFTNYFEFEYTLNYLLKHPAEYKNMQDNGLKYVQDNYQWEIIINKIQDLIERIT